jgi:hypothetical protein
MDCFVVIERVAPEPWHAFTHRARLYRRVDFGIAGARFIDLVASALGTSAVDADDRLRRLTQRMGGHK